MDPVNPNPQPNNNMGGGNTKPSGFMNTLEYYLVTKAPFQIPAPAKEFIVKFGPWFQVIALIVIVPMVLALIGLGTFLSFYTYRYGYGLGGWSLSSVASLISFVLGIIALPGLFARKLNGWNFAFYQICVSAIGSLVTMNIVGAIVGFIVGAYVLFQVRSYYH